MDERQLKIISAVGSLASLAAICLFVALIAPEELSVCDISGERLGTLVKVTGTVKDPLHAEGNVFFTLRENGCEVRVVLWKSIINALENSGIDVSRIKENATISVSGGVESHQGRLQVVPLRPALSIIDG
jgi:aspartyl/asparaginyl-tRNA synthetase